VSFVLEVDMRSRFRKLGLLAAVALVGTLVPLTQTQAGAAVTLDVSVGAFPSQTLPAESMRFFPRTIRVHQNDVLHFTSDSFHTATLLPASQTDPAAWAAANANPDGPWALFAPDTDDGAEATKLNNTAAFPTDPNCGSSGNPCPFDATDATGVLNSGLPLGGPLDFSVEVTATPGTTFHAICLVHNAMTMTIEVVDDAVPATTQQRIDETMATRLRKDRREARELDERLSRPRRTLLPNGTRRWRAFAGFDTENISLVAMYPAELNIRRGDRVRWSASENLVFEDHTVTGPRRKAIPIANSAFAPGCDPDGAGPGPDNPPEMENPPFCNDPSQLEIDFPSRFNRELGDGRVTRGGDLESSGVFGAGLGGPDFYTLRFPRRLDGPWGFMCLIHGTFMKGSVTIR
jgi:plastocyanin